MTMIDPLGRKIEFAAQVAIVQYEELMDGLLRRVFGIEGAWVSDESSLNDFDFVLEEDGNVEHETEEALARIKKIYGVDVSDVEGLNMVKICERISILGNTPL